MGLTVGAVLWLTAAGWGYTTMVGYSVTPNTVTVAPSQWPAGLDLQVESARPTLVLALHPKCPCSRATVAELANVVARTGGRASLLVLCQQPADAAPGWDKTSLMDDVGRLPGVRVVRDFGGAAALRLGTLTSGEAVLYSPAGQLLFRGGLTPSRGHRGACDAQDALADAILHGTPAPRQFTAYGCPIQN